jgi:crotonobetainyl-CoA:carnitine CoA-transferase CaiB-like acyl-CoA transferase
VSPAPDDTGPSGPPPAAAPPPGPTPGPLAGLVVADFSRVLAGPLATMTLADLGATVVKVERPEGGDETRSWGPPWWEGVATYYMALNRGKRSVVLDLAAPGDQALAVELALRAHVLVENFRPGTMDRLGLGYDALAARRPDLVYCSITGFGRAAGAAELAGYDFLAQALSGLMEITGQPDGPPTKAGIPVSDILTGLQATIGILAALNAVRDGRGGQRVEVSLLDASLAALLNHATAHLHGGAVPTRVGNLHPSIAPYEVFTTADRPIVVAVGNDWLFVRLCTAIERPDLAADARFATNAERVANRHLLTAELDRTMRTDTAATWTGRLQAAGVPAGPVQSVAEGFGLASALGLDPIDVVVDAQDRPVRTPRNPVRLSATPARTSSAPPGFGEHDAEVRAWLTAPRETPLA